jgi:hypothetical protein
MKNIKTFESFDKEDNKENVSFLKWTHVPHSSDMAQESEWEGNSLSVFYLRSSRRWSACYNSKSIGTYRTADEAKSALEEYIKGGTETPSDKSLSKSSTKDWYDEVGKYINERRKSK